MRDSVGGILAGGLSTRMGEPKHALRMPDGRTMIEHVRDALAPVCSKVVIVSSEEILADHEHVADNFDQLGPIGGIEALLSSDIANEYLIVPCDMPLLTRTVLASLAGSSGRALTVLHVEGEDRPRPLPMRISRDALPVIWSRIEEGDLSLQGLLAAADAEAISAPAEWLAALSNINTPDEFASLQKQAQM